MLLKIVACFSLIIPPFPLRGPILKAFHVLVKSVNEFILMQQKAKGICSAAITINFASKMKPDKKCNTHNFEWNIKIHLLMANMRWPILPKT